MKQFASQILPIIYLIFRSLLCAQDATWQDVMISIDVKDGDTQKLVQELSRAAIASDANKKGFKGIQIVCDLQGTAQRRMSLEVNNVPLVLAVKYVAEGFGFEYQCYDGIIRIGYFESTSWMFGLSEKVKLGLGMKQGAVPSVKSICDCLASFGIKGLNDETLRFVNGQVIIAANRSDILFLKGLISVFERNYIVSKMKAE